MTTLYLDSSRAECSVEEAVEVQITEHTLGAYVENIVKQTKLGFDFSTLNQDYPRHFVGIYEVRLVKEKAVKPVQEEPKKVQEEVQKVAEAPVAKKVETRGRKAKAKV